MLIPNSDRNIYPTTEENIRAILDYYFQIPDGDINWLFSQKKLKTNQIEFIARQVTNNMAFFQERLNDPTISNLMNYGVDAMTKLESEWKGSQPRLRIISEFKNLVEKSQDLNFRSN